MSSNSTLSPSYDDLHITTQTFIISTNLEIDCKALFEKVECVALQFPLCKTAMRINEAEQLTDGAIVYVEYKTHTKGTPFKKNKKRTMLNCITIIFKYDKYYNTKISSKGNIQITGCVNNETPFAILDIFWTLIKDMEGVWTSEIPLVIPKLRAFIYPVMINVNFNVGFEVNREILHKIINMKTKHKSILEQSDGYVGVNIKIFAKEEELEDASIVVAYLEQDDKGCWNKEWQRSETNFGSYLETIPVKDKAKKLAKVPKTTFLVFYSGRTIMSGTTSYANRASAYAIFRDIIDTYREQIQVK